MHRGSLVRLLLLALIWGSGFLWIKEALADWTPVQIVLVRLGLGCLVLAPLAFARRLRPPRDPRIWLHLFVAALVAMAIPYTLFGFAERTVDSGVAGAINTTTPLWTLLVAFVAGTDRNRSPGRIAGVLLGFLGTLLIFEPWRSGGDIASWGGLACLAAAASYGVSYVYMGRFLAGRGIPPIMLSAAQLGAGTALMALVAPFDWRTPAWHPGAAVSLLILGTIGTGVAYVLNYRLIGDEGATVASTTTYLLPIVAISLGALVADERITATMIGGTVLVLAGVALVQRSGRTVTARTAADQTANGQDLAAAAPDPTQSSVARNSSVVQTSPNRGRT